MVWIVVTCFNIFYFHYIIKILNEYNYQSMSDYQLVSQYEIARLVAKKMETVDKNQVKHVYAMPANVVKVFSTISKFTNYYFKKAQGSQGSAEFNTVICDVPVIGYFTFERGIDEPKFDFIPTPFFIQES